MFSISKLKFVFGSVTVLVFLLLLFKFLKPDPRIDLSERSYKLWQDVSPGWLRLCIFGRNEFPTGVERKYSALPCEIDYDLQSTSVTMVYYYKEKKCEHFHFEGSFIEKRGYFAR